jgi:glycosyltransferase involved in cell wall biosynthesis
MRIAILAHGVFGAGATSVAKNLIAALGRAAPDDHYGITIRQGAEYTNLPPRAEVFPYAQTRGKLGRWLWESCTLPKWLGEFKPDVMIGLADRGVIHPPCPQLVLIHRPALFYPARFSEDYPFMERLHTWYHARHLRKSLPHVDILLAQTEVARERLRQTYGFTGRIEICPNAVSAFVSSEPSDDVPEALVPLANRTKLFCLTRYSYHKNLEGIVEMFHRHGEELPDVSVILTLSPDQHPEIGKLLSRVDRLGLGKQVVNVGPIPQADIGQFYHHCDGLLLPTKLESFTGTYVEAMHFGTPILTSDLDFAHVVCGDAALYFDPWDPAAMRDAILRFKADPALAESLAKKGRERLTTLFRSWDEIAKDVHGWMQECVRDRARR